jgi:hypothetical protein
MVVVAIQTRVDTRRSIADMSVEAGSTGHMRAALTLTLVGTRCRRTWTGLPSLNKVCSPVSGLSADAAARRPVEIVNASEAVQDDRIYVERVNGRLFA